MSFIAVDPRHIWLEISPHDRMAAWQNSQSIQAAGARWQVYLNQLCLSTCMAWLQEDFGELYPSFSEQNFNPTQWELVAGSRIILDGVQLVLIPSDTVGQDELWVPQEWVDIPTWMANYYLAIKVNPNERWVEIWGYTTYETLKVQGEYDPWDRSYSLKGQDLQQDISALVTTIERCPITHSLMEGKTESEHLANLEDAQSQNLVSQLAREEVPFPRLSIPFTQWGALLANQGWWNQLIDQRSGTIARQVTLSQFLRGVEGAIATGWHSIESIFGQEAQQLAFGFREEPSLEGRQAKVLQFGESNSPQILRLVILWQTESDGRLAIRAQLYPAEGEEYLPSDVTFSLTSEQGAVLQSIQSSEENNYIQLKLFRCPPGYTFQLVVQYNDQMIAEQFVA